MARRVRTPKPKAQAQPKRMAPYRHPEATSLLRPDVGTQAQFRKKKPPQRYRYDSSLAPALEWDGQNPAREQGEALIRQILEADSIEAAKAAAAQLKALSEPFLNWAGKAERLSFDVPTLPLFVHERLSTTAILETLKGHKRDRQLSMFDLFADPQRPIHDQILRAYEYPDNWVNRLILGDSLVVMNSLLHYESLGGQVQMIYMDPPYGVRFGSNFQPFVRKRDVKHNDDEDLTREPEMVKAYRDTWELGLHSYLTYLRDRLLLCRELLAPSGSIFVQISDENLHHVREVMDEVFGAENFISMTCARKTGGATSETLATVIDFVIWYTRDRDHIKYHRLYVKKALGEEGSAEYTNVELADGTVRKVEREELSGLRPLPPHSRLFATDSAVSDGFRVNTSVPFTWRGITFDPGKTKNWKTSIEGMLRLCEVGRILPQPGLRIYKRYFDDFPYRALNNVWMDVRGALDRIYAVQTAAQVVERCVQMTTDPGDLVLDPTCVRRGTRVWGATEAPPLDPPVNGWKRNPLDLAVDGRRAASEEDATRSGPLPVRGEGQGGGFAQSGSEATATGMTGEGARLTPIESLQPGDRVYAHDGLPHRVIRVIARHYRGWMVSVQHAGTVTPLCMTADHRVLARLRPRSLGGQRDWSGSPPAHLERRRALRHDMSPPERALWAALRQRQSGFKFRRQHPVGPYIADFYCREAHLVVEVDGATHFTPQAIEYDHERDRYLRGLGLDVLRVPANEVGTNLEGVVLWIESQCRMRRESPEGAQWIQAGSLLPGDVVFWVMDAAPPLDPPVNGGRTNPLDPPIDRGTAGAEEDATRSGPLPVRGEGQGGGFSSHRAMDEVHLTGAEVTAVHREWSDERVYDLEVEGAHSFLTEVCAVHNCGSGTTAYVAEQWGRRWITIDTSRVPLALARQRLLTATFPFYQLKDQKRGPAGGFIYVRKQNNKGEEVGGIVPHVTLKSIANNEPPEEEVLVDRPEVESKITRVSGPFCVEATIPTPVDWEGAGVEDSGVGVETYGSFVDRMLEVLRKSPVLHVGGGRTVTLRNVRPPAKTLSLSAEAVVVVVNGNGSASPFGKGGSRGISGATAEGEIPPGPPVSKGEPSEEGTVAEPPGGDRWKAEGKPVAIVFGPDNGAVSEKLVYEAAREAHAKAYSHLYVIGFAIQPNARELVEKCDEAVGVPATYVQATPDLMMGDLLKNMRSSQIFSVCGLPEMRLRRVDSRQSRAGSKGEEYQVELAGLDVFDPATMEAKPYRGHDVPAWFLDTDYNGLCFHVCQAFFPRTAAWDDLKRALKGEYDDAVWEHLAGTISAPFEAGEHGTIAVKVIDDRGNELMVVKDLKDVEP